MKTIQTKPGIFTKLLSFTYDVFLVISCWFLIGFIVLFTYNFLSGRDDFSDTFFGPAIIIFTTVSYYVYFWSYGRRTLGMSTWSHELLSDDGKTITYKVAFYRFLLNLVLSIVSLMWQLFDKDKKLLSDRILGLRTIKKTSAS